MQTQSVPQLPSPKTDYIKEVDEENYTELQSYCKDDSTFRPQPHLSQIDINLNSDLKDINNDVRYSSVRRIPQEFYDTGKDEIRRNNSARSFYAQKRYHSRAENYEPLGYENEFQLKSYVASPNKYESNTKIA